MRSLVAVDPRAGAADLGRQLLEPFSDQKLPITRWAAWSVIASHLITGLTMATAGSIVLAATLIDGAALPAAIAPVAGGFLLADPRVPGSRFPPRQPHALRPRRAGGWDAAVLSDVAALRRRSAAERDERSDATASRFAGAVEWMSSRRGLAVPSALAGGCGSVGARRTTVVAKALKDVV